MQFRFVAATVKVPARQPVAGNNGPVALSLSGGGDTAALWVRAGGGARSIWYSNGFGHGNLSLAPRVGDRLRASVYHDPASGRDQFAVTNTSTGRTRTVPVATPASAVYLEASVTAGVDSTKVHAPVESIKLWSVKAVRITSYSGVRGTVIGPWSTSELMESLDGTSGSNVVLSPRPLWGNNQNFTIWLMEWPH
jgi:hypothetical protein